MSSEIPDDESRIIAQLKDITVPIIGMECVTEYYDNNNPQGVRLYKCNICKVQCLEEPMIQHLISISHKLKGVEAFQPEDYKYIMDTKCASDVLENLVDEWVEAHEKDYGSKLPMVRPISRPDGTSAENPISFRSQVSRLQRELFLQKRAMSAAKKRSLSLEESPLSDWEIDDNSLSGSPQLDNLKTEPSYKKMAFSPPLELEEPIKEESDKDQLVDLFETYCDHHENLVPIPKSSKLSKITELKIKNDADLKFIKGVIESLVKKKCESHAKIKKESHNDNLFESAINILNKGYSYIKRTPEHISSSENTASKTSSILSQDMQKSPMFDFNFDFKSNTQASNSLRSSVESEKRLSPLMSSYVNEDTSSSLSKVDSDAKSFDESFIYQYFIDNPDAPSSETRFSKSPTIDKIPQSLVLDRIPPAPTLDRFLQAPLPKDMPPKIPPAPKLTSFSDFPPSRPAPPLPNNSPPKIPPAPVYLSQPPVTLQQQQQAAVRYFNPYLYANPALYGNMGLPMIHPLQQNLMPNLTQFVANPNPVLQQNPPIQAPVNSAHWYGWGGNYYPSI